MSPRPSSTPERPAVHTAELNQARKKLIALSVAASGATPANGNAPPAVGANKTS